MPHTGHCPELVGALRAEERTPIHPECGCYSMTSSARNNTVCGIVSPSAFAVSRLMTRRIVPGCSTALNVGIIH